MFTNSVFYAAELSHQRDQHFKSCSLVTHFSRVSYEEEIPKDQPEQNYFSTLSCL